MTQEQIERLCTVDPKHFHTDICDIGDLFFTIFGNDVHIYEPTPKLFPNPIFKSAMCWWMLTQMPDNTILGGGGSHGEFSCFIPSLNGEWQKRVRGSGPTREDAVIEAYISYMTAKKEAKEVEK